MWQNKKFSPQSTSFIILFAIAVIGTLCAQIISDRLNIWGPRLQQNAIPNYQTVTYDSETKVATQTPSEKPIPAVDTTKWKTYTDKTYPLSFKYPPTWRVTSKVSKTDGDYIVSIDPGAKYYNIQIYASKTGFFALDGLPKTAATVGGQTALNVENMLFAVEHNNIYYTFDEGLSMTIQPQFVAIVNSVLFTQ